MFTFETFYLICFGVGVGYALIVGFFSGLLGGGHDIGGHDVSIGDHGDLPSGDFSGSVSFSPLSPVIISTFLAFFGGSGYFYIRILEIDEKISLIPALATAFIAGAAVFFIFDYVFKNVQGGIDLNIASLVGREAEVKTPIPADGMGEIVYVTSSGRATSPARSATGQAIPKNSVVVIAKIVGNVLLVKPAEMHEKAEASEANHQ